MAKDICERFGQRVKALRNEREWTQVYLSVHTGLSRTFISDLELGRKEPCLRSIEILAQGFGVSIIELMRNV